MNKCSPFEPYKMRLHLLLLLSVLFTSALKAEDYYIKAVDDRKLVFVMQALENEFKDFDVYPLLPSKSAFDFNKFNDTKEKLGADRSNFNGIHHPSLTKVELFLASSFRLNLNNAVTNKNAESVFNSIPEIEYFELCPVIEKHCTDFNDPLSSSQNLLDLIQLCEAWGIEKGDESIVIALSDDGLNVNHEDLIGKLYTNQNDPIDGIDNDNNGYVDDYQGYSFIDDGGGHSSVVNIDNHGSMVGGVFGAAPDNNLGIVGSGFNTKIFPIRVAPYDFSAPIRFGYESILYAASMGFDVINCSWGSVRNNSVFLENIVEFANERNLTIVNSVGNRRRSNGDKYRYSGQYPSAYQGVIGVGQSSSADLVDDVTNLGASVDVFAPGTGNYSISNTNNSAYEVLGSGTSFSAPVVAGVVGLIKSKWPGLNNTQIEAHIRNTSDLIQQTDDDYAALFPRRINALKAVATPPLDNPGIRFVSYEFRKNGEVVTDPDEGVEYDLVVTVDNVLKSASSVSANLAVIFGNNALAEEDKLELIDDEIGSFDIDSGQQVELSFKVRVGQKNYDRILLRISFDSDTYSAQTLFDIYNSNNIYDFGNEKIGVSVAENGLIGYTKLPSSTPTNNTDFFGNGLWTNGISDNLYSGFLFAFEADREIVATSRTAYNGDSEFDTKQRFEGGNTLVLETDNLPERLEMEIEKTIVASNDQEEYLEFKISVTHDLFEPLFNAGIGYFMDFDVAKTSAVDAVANIVTDTRYLLAPELQRASIAIATISRPDSSIFFSYAIRSDDENATAQLTATPSMFVTSSSDQDILEAMTAGYQLRGTGVENDIVSVFGMLWEGLWQPGETKKCTFCFGGGPTEAESVNNVIRCLNNYGTDGISISEADTPKKIRVRQGEQIELNGKDTMLVDIHGRTIAVASEYFSTDELVPGIYFVIVKGSTNQPLIISVGN